MRGYDTSDLHRLQHSGEAGNAVLTSVNSTGWRRWRPLVLPLAVLLVGLVLGMWGPLPGLGMVLVLGGMMATPVVAARALLSGLT